MTIAYPIKLRFIQNSMRHTVYTADMLKIERDLRGNVKAFVAEDAEAALNGLIDAVKKEYISLTKENHSTVQDSDFELIYSSEDIVDGRCWGGWATTSSKRLK